MLGMEEDVRVLGTGRVGDSYRVQEITKQKDYFSILQRAIPDGRVLIDASFAMLQDYHEACF